MPVCWEYAPGLRGSESFRAKAVECAWGFRIVLVFVG
jgi:hypothetical protein